MMAFRILCAEVGWGEFEIAPTLLWWLWDAFAGDGLGSGGHGKYW